MLIIAHAALHQCRVSRVYMQNVDNEDQMISSVCSCLLQMCWRVLCLRIPICDRRLVLPLVPTFSPSCACLSNGWFFSHNFWVLYFALLYKTLWLGLSLTKKNCIFIHTTQLKLRVSCYGHSWKYFVKSYLRLFLSDRSVKGILTEMYWSSILSIDQNKCCHSHKTPKTVRMDSKTSETLKARILG